MMRADLFDTPELPAAVREGWDGLAVARARPFSSPAWMLSWWRHARPSGAALQIVAVREGKELIGVLPFYAQRTGAGIVRYRLLASHLSAHVEPLARPGSESEVTAVAAALLASDARRPHVVSLLGMSSASSWPSLLATTWPGDHGVWVRRGPGMPAPRMTLEGLSYDDWFGRLSRHRRAELRRRRRRLEERGAVARLVTAQEEIGAALRDFSKLHHERWRRRGGSGVLDRPVEAMLEQVALELIPSARFRLWNIEVGGRPISSSLFVAAGGSLAYWLGGFDERWAAYGPTIETVRAAIEHAWEVGDRIVDFGPGGQGYKYTFAEGEDIVRTFDLVPRGDGSGRARMWLAPRQTWERMTALRYDAFGRLSPRWQQRLKSVRRRIERYRHP